MAPAPKAPPPENPLFAPARAQAVNDMMGGWGQNYQQPQMNPMQRYGQPQGGNGNMYRGNGYAAGGGDFGPYQPQQQQSPFGGQGQGGGFGGGQGGGKGSGGGFNLGSLMGGGGK